MTACACPRRTPSNKRAARIPAVLLVLLLLAGAQAISYTVQVVAVSEQESALAVQRTLLNEAFPAYVVRASTVQGDIFRVRVGAFGNRDAALLFAHTMPIVAGSPPLPALAEGIPAAVMPLEPRLLSQVDAPRLDLIPWGDGVAVRIQDDPALPATYRVTGADGTWSFEAWRAAPADDGVLLLRNLPLWPPTWESDVPEAREAYRLAQLESLASRFGVSPDELEELQARPVFGPPYLVVLELVSGPPAGGQGTALGVARPGGGAHGPNELVLGSAPLPPVAAPLYSASSDSQPLEEVALSDGWQVRASGEFFLLDDSDGGRGWRAGVGVPLWSDGEFLLTGYGERFLLYDFVVR